MPRWSVRVDLATEADDERARALAAELADILGRLAVHTSPSSGTADRVSALLAVEAATLRAAQEHARHEIAAALREHRGEVVGMDTRLWDETHTARDAPELMGVQEIVEAIGGNSPQERISRQRVHQIVKRADFPAPVARLASGSVWLGSDVRRFLATWERRAGRPPKREP
ncbi:hypothetical protein [Actinomadura rupiterrae]|uniref:hypothetical protein n=1 Tax=Actinomadura rupiterrae TaxID=559627 RepID=UPI0020A53CA0|nr:hypothetical protein [Actinomadura rupiterrae]MCP2339185.1 hypothetical protein [Actinomadura rupiterrae]